MDTPPHEHRPGAIRPRWYRRAMLPRTGLVVRIPNGWELRSGDGGFVARALGDPVELRGYSLAPVPGTTAFSRARDVVRELIGGAQLGPFVRAPVRHVPLVEIADGRGVVDGRRVRLLVAVVARSGRDALLLIGIVSGGLRANAASLLKILQGVERSDA